MSTANTLAPASRDAIRGFSLPQVSRPTTLQTLPPPAPDAIRAQQRLLDSHGRTIRDLRLSITDRCNFRCVYCMEPDTKFMPGPTLLDTHELVRIAAELMPNPAPWMLAAGLGWLAVFTPWVLRSLWIYATPRADGKPG